MILDIDGLKDDSSYWIPDKYRSPMTYMVRNILSLLNGYNDYIVTLKVESQTVSMYEAMERSWCLEYLKQNKIINYVESENSDTVTVLNRYNLELLALLLGGKKDFEQLPNLIYYQPSTGRGFVNGHPIKLKRLNKRLFDTLFMAAPEPASRDLLRKAVRTGKARDTAGSYDISQAFSNLCKACKVSAKVITLRDSGILNAQVFTLESSFFSNDFAID